MSIMRRKIFHVGDDMKFYPVGETARRLGVTRDFLYSDRRDEPPEIGGRIVKRFAVPLATVAVYLFAFVSWAFSMLFTYSLLEYMLRGHIEKYSLTIFIILFGCGAFLAAHLRTMIKDGIRKAVALFQPAAPGGTDDQNLNPLMTKEPTAMAENENPSFTFTAPVTITNSTNHNAPGGIISNAPVTVNQYYDKPKPVSSTIDAEIIEKATVVPNAETVSLDELHARAEKFMGRPIAENTIRNVLERASVESCGEEERGRARAKLYPKEQAEKAIADYVAINKRK
jgi:hypothetical protein